MLHDLYNDPGRIEDSARHIGLSDNALGMSNHPVHQTGRAPAELSELRGHPILPLSRRDPIPLSLLQPLLRLPQVPHRRTIV